MDERRILKPLSTVQLLDETFYLIKDNFILFLFVCIIPKTVIGLLGAYTLHQGLTYLLLQIIDSVLEAAGVYLISRRYLGYTVRIWETYHKCFQKILPVLVTTIYTLIMIIGGFILLIIPGLVFYVNYFLVIPVCMIEGKSGWSAMTRSRDLVRDNFYQILGIVAVVIAINIIGSISIGALIPITMPRHAIIVESLQQLVDTSVSLVILVMTVLLYFDIRVKREGFDLEMLAASMESQTTNQTNMPDKVPMPTDD